MAPIRAVLDTNIYIQSLMRPGSFLDELIRRLVVTGQAELYSSPEILLELRLKAETKFEMTAGESLELMSVCQAIVTVVEPTQRVTVVRSDPDDNKILECALQAKADLIVSADKDLLKLKRYEGITITHPSMLKYWFALPDAQ